jgi:hypothetical protein
MRDRKLCCALVHNGLPLPHACKKICKRQEHGNSEAQLPPRVAAVSAGVTVLVETYPSEALGCCGAELKNCLGKPVFVGQVAIELNARLHLAVQSRQNAPC